MGEDKILVRFSWESSFPLGNLSGSSHFLVHGHGLTAGEWGAGLDCSFSFSFQLQVLTPSSVPQHEANRAELISMQTEVSTQQSCSPVAFYYGFAYTETKPDGLSALCPSLSRHEDIRSQGRDSVFSTGEMQSEMVPHQQIPTIKKRLVVEGAVCSLCARTAS